MEILIAVVALAVGFAIAFVLVRNNRSNQDSGAEMAIRLEEREKNFEREMAQRLEAQRLTFETRLNEKNESALRERELIEESHRKEMAISQETARRELENQKLHYEEMLDEKERTYREAIEQRDKVHADNLRKLENTYKADVENVRNVNAKSMAELELRHEQALQNARDKFSESANTLAEQIKNVTAEMLKERQKEFSEKSRESIGQILDPLQATINEMRKAVTDNTNQRTELGGQLDAGIKNLLHHTQLAQASAEKLASALRGNNRVQGDWGEQVLKELLESIGLTEGIHFDTQTSFKPDDQRDISGESSRLRPDVILHLDNQRELIIDSKVSLSAYLDYREAQTDEARAAALGNHIKSLQNHVKELARKDYSRYIKAPKSKIDYVIMFVPNTSALLLATAHKPDLWRKAMEDNVYIADEQTLYAALRIIEMTWTQIAQARNQEKVFDLAGEMIDRVEAFLKSFKEIESKLNAAQASYEAAKKKLEPGGHSIPQTARKLLDMGARSSKSTANLDKMLGMADGELLSE